MSYKWQSMFIVLSVLLQHELSLELRSWRQGVVTVTKAY
jgi:hypothetical protein